LFGRAGQAIVNAITEHVEEQKAAVREDAAAEAVESD
jgi:hypothetical protein